MNSLPNHHFQNKSFYQLSFDGGHLTQYGGLIFFQELFSQLKLKELISKYLVTNDQRRYCRYSDSDILVQFLFQLLTGYGTDYACKELSADAYFPKLLEGGQLASQPTLSRFLSRTDEETVHSLRCLNLELVEFFLQFHQLNQLIVDIDSTHFTTYGKQEGVAYNAHYRAHGYHPLYAFEGKTGYCFNAQLRPGNRYCSEEADSFITPVLERFNQLLFRRKFIDMELGQIKPIYLSDLTNYNHILKQRNTYLKSAQKIDETFLSVLDDQLVDYGCRVMNHRLDFIKKLESFGRKKHFELSNQIEELSISYQSSVNITDKQNLSESFKIALEKSRSRDLFKKNTGVGPHRDDISFYINGMDASFGSQGQHRSLVLSIKLAEIELMESITTESPILLLDDVMSELDNTRQLKLLETISQSIQTFITTTSLDHLQNLPENLSIFTIQDGKAAVNGN